MSAHVFAKHPPPSGQECFSRRTRSTRTLLSKTFLANATILDRYMFVADSTQLADTIVFVLCLFLWCLVLSSSAFFRCCILWHQVLLNCPFLLDQQENNNAWRARAALRRRFHPMGVKLYLRHKKEALLNVLAPSICVLDSLSVCYSLFEWMSV